MITNALKEFLGLATGCAVTQGNSIHLIGLNQVMNLLGSALDIVVWSSGINHVVVQQIAILIKAHHLATGAEAWVNGKYALVAQWWSKEQLTHVLGKHVDCLGICALLRDCCKLVLNRWLDESPEAVLGSLLNQLRRLALAMHHDAAHVVDSTVIVDIDAHLQESLLLATPDGKQLMRRDALEWFREVVVELIVATLNLLAFHHTAIEDCVITERAPHTVAHRCVLTHPLGNNIESTIYGLVATWHLVAIDKSRCHLVHITAFLRHNHLGKRLKAFFPRHLCTSATLGLVRQINVL